ncbi:TPA: RepB family plasmid replication initiator protein [Photobacterium damselae]
MEEELKSTVIIDWDGEDSSDRDEDLIDTPITYQMPAELKYVIPTQFLYGRQELKKNQRKIVALLLLHVKQQRDKLYEIDPIGKAEAAKLLTKEEKSQHFNEYIPSADLLPKRAIKVKFGQDIISKIFPGMVNAKRAIELALKGVMGRVVHEEELDSKGRSKVKMYVIIPRAEIHDGEIELLIDHDAIKKLMVHSNGYSDTDLNIWTDLDSGYAQKLLEVLSKHKDRTDGLIMELDKFKFIFGCDYKTYTLADRERWKDEGSIGDPVIIGSYVLKNGKKVPMYSRFDAFKNRVLDISFSSLINDSQGHWVATDKPVDSDGNPLPQRGYELIRTGRKITHIKFCVKYIKNPSSAATKKLENKDKKKNDDNGINAALLYLLNQCEASFSKVDEIKQFDQPFKHITKALKTEWEQNLVLFEANSKIVGYKPNNDVVDHMRMIKALLNIN